MRGRSGAAPSGRGEPAGQAGEDSRRREEELPGTPVSARPGERRRRQAARLHVPGGGWGERREAGGGIPARRRGPGSGPAHPPPTHTLSRRALAEPRRGPRSPRGTPLGFASLPPRREAPGAAALTLARPPPAVRRGAARLPQPRPRWRRQWRAAFLRAGAAAQGNWVKGRRAAAPAPPSRRRSRFVHMPPPPGPRLDRRRPIGAGAAQRGQPIGGGRGRCAGAGGGVR